MSHIRKLYFLKQILSLSIPKRNVQNLTVLRVPFLQRCYAGLGILKTHNQNEGEYKHDLAKAELAVTAIFTVTIQPDSAFFMPILLLFVNIFQSFLMCFRLLATFLATQHCFHFHI